MMPGSLSRLIARSLGLADVIQPVLPSRFEPPDRVPAPGASFEPDGEREPTEWHSPGVHANVATFAPTARGDPNDSEDRARAPAPASRRPIESARSRRPPGSRVSDGRGPLEAGSAARSPNHGERSATPGAVPPMPVFPGVRLAPDQPAATLAEADRGTRHIIPAEIHARRADAGDSRPPVGRAEARQRVSGETAPEGRTVTVHIGRIEVRAVVAPAREQEQRHREDPPRLTLSAYLAQREKGSR